VVSHRPDTCREQEGECCHLVIATLFEGWADVAAPVHAERHLHHTQVLLVRRVVEFGDCGSGMHERASRAGEGGGYL